MRKIKLVSRGFTRNKQQYNRKCSINGAKSEECHLHYDSDFAPQIFYEFVLKTNMEYQEMHQ